jgi:hypothetical protein
MSVLAIVLTSILGAGGLSGVVALLKLRTEKDSSVVDMVGRGMLVLERLNDRLERELQEQQEARRAAEVALEQAYSRIRELEGGRRG